MTDPRGPWAPFVPHAAAPWDLGRVVHLHRRAGFAATWDEIRRDLADGPEPSIGRLLAGTSAPPGRPGTLREARRHLGRRRHRRPGTAQGVVGLPHALRARPAGRAADAHVARPFRHQQPQGQRPRRHAAAERDVPPPCPRRRSASCSERRRPRPGAARLARRAGQPQGAAQREPRPRADGAVHARHRPLHRGRRQGGRASPDRLDGRATARSARIAARARRRREDDPGPRRHVGRRTDLVAMLLEHPATAAAPGLAALRARSSARGRRRSRRSAVLAAGLRHARPRHRLGRRHRAPVAAFFARDATCAVVSSSPVEFVVGAVRALELLDPPPSTLLLAEWAARLGQDLFYPAQRRRLARRSGLALDRARSIGRANYAAALVGGRASAARPADALALAERLGFGRDLGASRPPSPPSVLLGVDGRTARHAVGSTAHSGHPVSRSPTPHAGSCPDPGLPSRLRTC